MNKPTERSWTEHWPFGPGMTTALVIVAGIIVFLAITEPQDRRDHRKKVSPGTATEKKVAEPEATTPISTEADVLADAMK